MYIIKYPNGIVIETLSLGEKPSIEIFSGSETENVFFVKPCNCDDGLPTRDQIASIDKLIVTAQKTIGVLYLELDPSSEKCGSVEIGALRESIVMGVGILRYLIKGLKDYEFYKTHGNVQNGLDNIVYVLDLRNESNQEIEQLVYTPAGNYFQVKYQELYDEIRANREDYIPIIEYAIRDSKKMPGDPSDLIESLKCILADLSGDTTKL